MKAQQDLACISALCLIHPTLRADPFRIFAPVLTGKPKPIGVRCQAGRKPVRRAYSPAELTGWVFGYYACACTILSQLGQVADPTPEQWSKMVAEAKRLVRGAVKVQAAMVEESPDAGGYN